jgi:hypothetical protein
MPAGRADCPTPLHAMYGMPWRTPLLRVFAAGQGQTTTARWAPLLFVAVPCFMPQTCPSRHWILRCPAVCHCMLPEWIRRSPAAADHARTQSGPGVINDRSPLGDCSSSDRAKAAARGPSPGQPVATTSPGGMMVKPVERLNSS